MPDCSTGAVTMKMISSTSTTSTSGVMLMSEREVWVRPLAAVKAITAAPPGLRRFVGGLRLLALDRVQHLQREVIAAGSKVADRSADQVVGDHGRDGGRQSGGRGNQGFGNSGSDRAQGGGARGAQTVESINDAPYRSEQADKRRDRRR